MNNLNFRRGVLFAAAFSMLLSGCGMEPIVTDTLDLQQTTEAATAAETSAVTASESTTVLTALTSVSTQTSVNVTGTESAVSAADVQTEATAESAPAASSAAENTAAAERTTASGAVTTAAQAVTTASSATATETTASSAVSTKQYDTGEGTTRKENGILIIHSGTDHPRALEIYEGNFPLGTRFANAVNKWKARIGSSVNVWCMVPPTSYSFYKPADREDKGGTQEENLDHIAGCLEDVTFVPIWNILNARKDEPIYSLTDYHWQQLGAYYAAEQFARIAEVPYESLDSYTPVTREGYVGAFYWVNKVKELNETREPFVYYKPSNLDTITTTYFNTSYKNPHEGNLLREDMKVGASYQIFGGTDELILQVETDAPNERVLVIFKDSFGNALVPCLTHSFKKIILCDFRYFDLDPIQFMKDVGATDLLFCINASTLMSSTKIKAIDNLVK